MWIVEWGSILLGILQDQDHLSVNHSGWVSYNSSSFAARQSWSTGSFLNQQVWIMSGPGPIQLFIPKTLSWLSDTVIVTVACSWFMVWFTGHQCYVMPPFPSFSSSLVQSPAWVVLLWHCSVMNS